KDTEDKILCYKRNEPTSQLSDANGFHSELTNDGESIEDNGEELDDFDGWEFKVAESVTPTVLVDVEYDLLILKEQKTELVGLKFIDSLFMQMENLNELNELTCFNLTGKMTSILFVVWISFLILQVVKIRLGRIPMKLWTESGMIVIVNVVGKPITLDLATKESRRLSYARVTIKSTPLMLIIISTGI
uniref:Uncharacterized protein n=1 Tax=Cucumis melo TaxID=3656 RepID=A0A9I9ECC9_CUCME